MNYAEPKRNYQLDLYHKINFPITQGATQISFKINKGDPYFRFCTQGFDPTSSLRAYYHLLYIEYCLTVQRKKELAKFGLDWV